MSSRGVTKRNGPTVTDSSDEAQVKKAMDHEKDVARDLEFIMKSPRGRRWLYGVIYDKCHVRSLSHVPRDTHSTAFNEGARSVGEALLEEVSVAHHALYIKMLEENDHAE